MSGKVGGPSGPRPPVDPEATQAADQPAAADPARQATFAGKVDEAAASAATSPTSAPSAASSSDPIALISADLDAGRITPEMAIQRIVDASIDSQLGPDAPAAVRSELRAVLEQLLREDPHLGSLG